MFPHVRLLSALGALALLACQKTPAPPPADSGSPSTPEAGAPLALVGHRWVLAKLGEREHPVGAGDRPPTLSFEGDRAAGFAGCNRFSGSYTAGADSLTFGPLLSTKMACPGADQVEAGYLAALAATRTYAATDRTLTLRGDGAIVAEFLVDEQP